MAKVYIKYASPKTTISVTTPVGNNGDMVNEERIENPLYPHNVVGTGSSNTAVYDYVMDVHTSQKNPTAIDMQKNPSYHTARFT